MAPRSGADAAGASAGVSAGVDWRSGGSTAWKPGLVVAGVIAAALGLVVAGLVGGWLSGLAARIAGSAAIWAGMAIPVVFAFAISRPRGLLRFRAVDLLYGVVLGVGVRFVQGWIEGLDGSAPVFPSFARLNGELERGWQFTEVIAPVLIAPVVEEFFFRGLILVGVFIALRRAFGPVAAGVVAWAASTALFALAHLWGGTSTWQDAASLIVVGGVCGMLVLTTGRIWAAVVTHIVYNGMYAALAAVGSIGG